MRKVSDVLVRAESLADICARTDDVSGVLRDVGFCIIRGVFPPGAVTADYERYRAAFAAANDIRRSGRIVRAMKNFQRLDCGDYAQVNARFCRTIVGFFWNAPTPFTPYFAGLQRLRDAIGGRRIAYENGCYEMAGRPYFELPKILQYPRGGGFLNSHYDGYNNDGVFNIGMSVTQKGRDFESGGIFYKYRDGEESPIEDILEPGDIYVHDEQAEHGVHAIDADVPLDLESFAGRVSLILSSEVFAA